MAFLEDNKRGVFVPRHLQRPPNPVVRLNRPLPPPSTTVVSDPDLTRSEARNVKRAAAKGLIPRPRAAPVANPVIAEPDNKIVLAPYGKPMIRQIIAAAVSASGIKHEILIGGSRSHKIVPWRMAGMYLTKKLIDPSLPEIGRHFHRDHSTVLHSIRVAEGRPEIMDKVEKILAKLIVPEVVE